VKKGGGDWMVIMPSDDNFDHTVVLSLAIHRTDFAGIRYEGMDEGVFAMDNLGGYLNKYKKGCLGATVEEIESGELRPRKPLQVAFYVEEK